MVEDVFKEGKSYQRLLGPFGIGHVRYPTAGSSREDEAQPFYTNYPFGIALGHNGNLTNVNELRDYCRKRINRQINTGSDSELLLAIFSSELGRLEEQRLSKQTDSDINDGPSVESVFGAVARCMELCRGAYAVVILINGFGIVGFRDPCGIRPLCFGSRSLANQEKEFMIASESVPIEIAGFSVTRDVNPGEAVIIDCKNPSKLCMHEKQCAPIANTMLAPCIFEFVYFARQDSIIDGASVYDARVYMGDRLGKRIKTLHPDCKIDVVIPVPSTSRVSAAQCAAALGVPYMEGLVRNRYTQRTFIMPGQTQRKKSIRLKLNPVASVIRGKSVLIVDDSVVRGTTSKHIVEIVRAAGAAHVYFASAAPAIRHPNVYGIDMPTREELIAYQRTDDEVAACISADWIVYQTIADLKSAVRAANPKLKQYDMSCFDGVYVAGQLDDAYFEKLGQERNELAKTIKNQGTATLQPTSSSSSVSGSVVAAVASPKASADGSKKQANGNGESKQPKDQKRLIRVTPSSSSIAEF